MATAIAAPVTATTPVALNTPAGTPGLGRKLSESRVAFTHMQWPSGMCQLTASDVGCNLRAGVTATCCDGPGAPGCDAPLQTVGRLADMDCISGSKPMCCPTNKGRRV